MQKIVIPNVTISSNGAATECFYNGNMFSGVLYTKMPKTYPSNTTFPIPAPPSGAYQPWPYAVEVQQRASGGDGVPDCYQLMNGNTGAHVDVGTESSGKTCLCAYQNYGT